MYQVELLNLIETFQSLLKIKVSRIMTVDDPMPRAGGYVGGSMSTKIILYNKHKLAFKLHFFCCYCNIILGKKE